MKLKNSNKTLQELLKKQPDSDSKPVKDFTPKPKKSPEVMAMDSISWQLKRIADLLESNND